MGGRFGSGKATVTGAVLAGTIGLAGCADGFYAQSIGGHLEMMSQRQDIAEALAEPGTPPELAARLTLVTELVAYATTRLALPNDGSYRTFVDVGRPYVVWNVFAAPPLSLAPLEWCYPVAGCASYRGYFAEEDAIAYGDGLRAEGYDVYVGGARAYSTLGWFEDPVPSTILFDPDYALAGTIFHELAHQRVYIQGDATFNESYATAVELAAVELWLADYGTPALTADFHRRMARQDVFLALVQETRAELDTLYRSAVDPEEMLAQKAAILDNLRARYARLRTSWGGYAGYDAWFAEDLNNAKLALVETYTSLIDGFLQLLANNDGDWERFHGAVEELAALPKAERDAVLAALAGQ